MYFQLIYRSRCLVPGRSSVKDIVDVSEHNNGRDRITGYLLFDKTHFLQILEGDEQVVRRAFGRITKDKRHTDVVVLAEREISIRSFPEWSMGGTVRSPELEHIFNFHRWRDVETAETLPDGFVALARDISEFEKVRGRERGLSRR